MPIAAIPAHQDILFDYLTERFRLTNTDLPCQITRPTSLMLNEATSKVLVGARWRCPTELGLLVIDSTLFHDELTPHDMIGNFHHLRALERYFFSKNTRQARIDVPRLAQLLPSEIGDPRQFRTATPPPSGGSFEETARRSAELADQVVKPSKPASSRGRGLLVFPVPGHPAHPGRDRPRAVRGDVDPGHAHARASCCW